MQGRDIRVGVALGAGGARGYAHIGVLKALEEEGIVPDVISGSSIGAVIGGAYALYGNAGFLRKLAGKLAQRTHISYFNPFSKTSHSFLTNWLIHVACDVSSLRMSIYSHRRNLEALEFIFRNFSFDDTLIPFSAIAVDILSGEVVSLKTGSLVEGILASISIPGIFPPVEREGMLLVDGGVLAEVPVKELRNEGADFLIAVRLVGEEETTIDYTRNGFALLSFLDLLKGKELVLHELSEADFVIEINLPGIDIMRFDAYAEGIDMGYTITKKLIPELKNELQKRRIWR